MRQHRRIWLFAAAILAATGTQAQDVEEGKALYAVFCATCHGQAAQGNGPTAEIMVLNPTDLTRLSASNGGTFPMEMVVRRIDGRDPVVAHGSPMPVFGPFFEGDPTPLKTASGQPIMTSRSVADLVTWLQTIQESE